MNLQIGLNSTYRFSKEEKKINFNWKRKKNEKGCIIEEKEEKILKYNSSPLKQCILKIYTTSILRDEIIEQLSITGGSHAIPVLEQFLKRRGINPVRHTPADRYGLFKKTRTWNIIQLEVE